jgi:hypothetical protein
VDVDRNRDKKDMDDMDDMDIDRNTDMDAGLDTDYRDYRTI